ncbi:hypothetical protein A3A34_04260 [Candidatus Kaiserbacteria bacterium RIFCSPLOWO2_01_FULL_50_24]|uniref:Transposase IS200-like domain-containing protein n=1 Tax=Candidatus Kaiserbacteria bacterium RIFCSPLOWO2_01_FULL_50_24 TaxID=1798507 RepID=A0A1F6EMY7_9BACT|nr:MAG: hypothetical protein A3A34_04260 [Candidatus Kaiserbacteria bacterium RIFCSPLOWO2_01_FULL_50_24]
MSERSVRFAPGEWFHCYTRGVDKRQIYMDEHDAERYQMLLYTCNSTKPIHISNIRHRMRQGPTLPHVLALPRGKLLVDIAAYVLMPNHPHLLLREHDYGGISSFMQKLGTAYTMYFNQKHERTGALLSGRFKASHVPTDSYFRYLINYIHGNPAEMYEASWKKGVVKNESSLRKQLCDYPFSSLPDYQGIKRPHNAIINASAALDLLGAVPTYARLRDDAHTFYRQERDFLTELDA